MHHNCIRKRGAGGCGIVAELDSPDTFSGLARQAAAQGFKPERTVVEIAGRCSHCAGSA